MAPLCLWRHLWILMSVIVGIAGPAFGQEAHQVIREDRRVVGMMAYFPKGKECRGIAIISPGAGGSEQGYRYVGEAMSSLGYLAVVVGHPESGRDALREHVRGKNLSAGLAELITQPQAYRGRFMDIVASRQWANERCTAIGSLLIGHSMGAATAMIEAGARNKLGLQGADSFNAYIALSPQGAGIIFPVDAWSNIGKPVLLLTGTNDSELGSASWETRTEPFKNMPAGCKWLGVIDQARHLDFSGHGMSRKTEKLTSEAIGEFLNAIHQGDCGSAVRLQGMELKTK